MNGRGNWTTPVVVAVLCATTFWLGLAIGIQRGAKAATDAAVQACIEQVDLAVKQTAETTVDLTMPMVVDETAKAFDDAYRPVLQQCADGWQAALDDLVADGQWHQDLAEAYHGRQPLDLQDATDLLWCAVGRATPMESCLAMLEAGR